MRLVYAPAVPATPACSLACASSHAPLHLAFMVSLWLLMITIQFPARA
eukprot:CAMPEP_0185173434 /NCGR_PEP_ID=MMETSP1139-20130426/23439_1 /TAXON_ID=298111 /ORGANISM="Pavlova sp., Strain CCMP459" /LENGTH=47 /DNA_ID= /DNA_START= /DNA_END= /DNA_ORIENTATION=